jgi:hypothetical protein
LFRLDVASGEMIHAQIAENGISSAVRCGQYLAAASYDGAIYLVDPRDLSVVNALRVMRQRLHAPSWAPNRATHDADAATAQ